MPKPSIFPTFDVNLPVPKRGGVMISGKVGNVGGDIVGGDKITYPPPADLTAALASLRALIAAAPAELQPEAAEKLEALTQEAAKGPEANDGAMARAVDGLVDLIPTAAAAVASAFAQPVLAGIAGPVTSFVLEKLRGA
jgi:hypothetical protein